MDKKSKRILVTGGGGYLGSVLTTNLLADGYRVRVLDNFSFGLDSIRSVINNPNLDVAIGDVRNAADVRSALDGIDSVVHLAAIVGDPACDVQATVAIEVNLLSTARLVRSCREREIERFIFASSCSVYGSNDTLMLDEKSALNPVSLYADTKMNAEKEILGFSDKGFSPCIFRFATLYGVSPRMRFDLIINFLTQRAFAEKEIAIFGGDQWRPFLHVADAAEAIQIGLEAPIEKIRGEVFNAGSTNGNYQMKDIGRIVEQITKGITVNYIKQIKDYRSYNICFGKIKKVLGFDTSRSIEDGIAEILDTLKSGAIKNIKDPKYYNYH